MKIGLEISSLSFPLSGIQIYIKNFLENLLKIDKENSYILTAKLQRISKINGYRPEPFWFRKYDIFHGFDGFIPRFIQAKLKSAVVHDVIPLIDSSFVSDLTKRNFEKKIQKLVRRADMLIAPSEYTKNSLASFFSSKQIHVLYEACSENFKKLPEESIREFKRRNDLSNYLLFVGVINARKNVDGLIKAFNKIKDKFKNLKLVIISSYTGYGSENVINLIEENRDNVIFIRSVSESDLIYFYNSATLFVFPSFAEGFGLPVLEAMACGTPVLTSKISALTEVGGDAVEYINPYDVENIAQKILNLLGDDKKRIMLSEKGIKQAGRFSWGKSASKLINIWEKCLK